MHSSPSTTGRVRTPSPTDDFYFVGNLHYSPYYHHIMPNSSVFDRLSTTPTKASSNRDEEKKIHNNEKMALRKAEEALASPRKGGVNIYTPANSSPSLTSPKRTPREMNQFFERISKQDTESSKIHHHEIERNSSPTKKKSCAKEGDDVIAALFVNNEVVDLATMIPEVRISIINNCKQKLSSRSCALDIIEALWKRDYIDHYTIGWDVYPASGEESRDHEGVWDVQKKAVKDHKGNYQSVVAKGKVKFVKGEGVFVDGYSFMKFG